MLTPAAAQATVRVASEWVSMGITVLESGGMDCLFGLDMLRRYGCAIDLKANVLRFQNLDNQPELPFLPEHELPDSAKLFAAGRPASELTHDRNAGMGCKRCSVVAALLSDECAMLCCIYRLPNHITQAGIGPSMLHCLSTSLCPECHDVYVLGLQLHANSSLIVVMLTVCLFL